MSRARVDEAQQQMRRIAKINGRRLRESELVKLNTQQENEKKSEEETPRRRVTIIDLLRSRVLFLRLANVGFSWMVCVVVYFGLNLNAGSLSGSPYLNVALSGLMEAVGYVLAHFAMTKIGRKWPLCISLVTAGAMCILTLFPVIYGDTKGNTYHAGALVALSMLGKLGISSAFAIIYLFTAELFPTVVRGATLGLCSTLGRAGGILSPYLADLSMYVRSDFGQALPLIVFGVMSVTAGGLAMLLPETRNRKLPDTLEDGECMRGNQGLVGKVQDST